MNDTDFISAAVVTYNDAEKAVNICKLLIKYTVKYPLKLYVIDNASTDETVRLLSGIENITIIKNKQNLGFGAAHNQVLSLSLGKYHFVINPDIEIDHDILSEMVDFMEENDDTVMAMPRIINSDGTNQMLPKEKPTFKRLYLGRLSKFGGLFRRIRDRYTWADKTIDKVTDIDFCSGCFFCIRSEVFIALHGFDQRYFMYLEDADLTLTAKKFGRVVIAPQFSVVHLWERDSSKKLKYLLIHINSSFKFLKKWRKYNQ